MRGLTPKICLLLPLAFVATGCSRSQFRIGRDITVAPRDVSRSAFCILCSVRVDGNVRSHVGVVAGDAFIDGRIGGNVLELGGSVTLTGTSTVEGRVLVLGGYLHREPKTSIGHGQIVISPIVFLPAILVLVAFIGGIVFLLRRRYMREVVYPPLPRFRA